MDSFQVFLIPGKTAVSFSGRNTASINKYALPWSAITFPITLPETGSPTLY